VGAIHGNNRRSRDYDHIYHEEYYYCMHH